MARRKSAYVTAETLAAASQRWLAAVRESVRPRPAFRIDVPRCALLVVDMLRYFAAPDGRCFLPAAGAIVPTLGGLLSGWRRAGGRVVYTRHCHEGRYDTGMLGRFFSDYIRAGEPESEILPALAPLAGEAVVRKKTYDAFLGTGMEEMLRSVGMEQILVTGVLTHMCCETTARSAFCRGFEVYVAADATADISEPLHTASLMSMADSCAIVLGSSEVLASVLKTEQADAPHIGVALETGEADAAHTGVTRGGPRS